MGNLAMKSEVEWQARMLEWKRVDIRVMRTDGTEVEEFDRRVVVAEIVDQFPDYVIVERCPMRKTKLGKRGQLRVLQRHDVLMPGKVYVLFPIPAEILMNLDKGNSRRSRRMQSCKDRLNLLVEKSGMAAELAQENSIKAGIDCPDRVQGPSEIPGFECWWKKGLNGDGASLIDSGGDPNNPCLHSSWRPALLSIPESPDGFHSKPESPMTPMTPIAFRLMSFRQAG